ncbi:unnamed protein product [Dracunculus medinensis]|uniref:Uncharacterized protein n=1 Tax=Dracunculus medinensis TaxID=318479 RepID=A0A3P7TD22_DRAME|nr:unnamed protein product [Dracunculus medinensis]
METRINRCFRTICRDWIQECHLFCDPLKIDVSFFSVSINFVIGILQFFDRSKL